MAKKMLIDATHDEETRITIVAENKLEEMDFEIASKKQLKGNVYLARVTRVEPSLQAAFVEYGGGRHGFLAFSEIHPDYYHLPAADKLALKQLTEKILLEEEQERQKQEEQEQDISEVDSLDSSTAELKSEPAKAKLSAKNDSIKTQKVALDANASPISLELDNASDDISNAIEALSSVAKKIENEKINKSVKSNVDKINNFIQSFSNHIATASSLCDAEKSKEDLSNLKDDLANANSTLETFSFNVEQNPVDFPTLQDNTKALISSFDDLSSDINIAMGDLAGVDSSPNVEQKRFSLRRGAIRRKMFGTSDSKFAKSQKPKNKSNLQNNQSTEHSDGDVDASLIGDEDERRRRRGLKMRVKYKIQEVIKTRQVLLIQVVKEERGNKGAALTTYLSLAGRYCVLMPNALRSGGGVSRKITSNQDRTRLKKILSKLEKPTNMGVILRTAGGEKSKLEIEKDFSYTLRTWDKIRTTTLKATAPQLIYEEASLLHRAIRDMYATDIEEIIIAGDDAYKYAKNLMGELMASHVKKIKLYKDDSGMSLFQRYQVETQLSHIYDATAQLKSGGSIVINQTEALVAIDVNSGSSTKERSIDATAIKTNVEAAGEIARQLRLRDMAGLIVIDFIDMETKKSNILVERKLKEALSLDRARIQIGQISKFGLLEMSRQRLRPSLIEATSEICPTCAGSGSVPSTEVASMMVIRIVEEEALKRRASVIVLNVPSNVASYLLNKKRDILFEIDKKFNLETIIHAKSALTPPNYEMTLLDGNQNVISLNPKQSTSTNSKGKPRKGLNKGNKGQNKGNANKGQSKGQLNKGTAKSFSKKPTKSLNPDNSTVDNSRYKKPQKSETSQIVKTSGVDDGDKKNLNSEEVVKTGEVSNADGKKPTVKKATLQKSKKPSSTTKKTSAKVEKLATVKLMGDNEN